MKAPHTLRQSFWPVSLEEISVLYIQLSTFIQELFRANFLNCHPQLKLKFYSPGEQKENGLWFLKTNDPTINMKWEGASLQIQFNYANREMFY